MQENHRKTKVINPGYQYREAFTTVLLAIIAINFFIIFGALSPESVGTVMAQSKVGYYVVGIVEVLLIIFCWKRSINATHRVAGPVYAIEREIGKLRDGDLTASIKLRPGDQFQQSVETINSGLVQLRESVRDIKDLVRGLEKDSSPENFEKLNLALARLKTEAVEQAVTSSDSQYREKE